MNIVILMNGGVIQHIITDEKVRVCLVDYDAEGADLDEIQTVFNDEAVVNSHYPVDVNEPLVKDYLREVSKEEKNFMVEVSPIRVSAKNTEEARLLALEDIKDLIVNRSVHVIVKRDEESDVV